MARPLDPRLRLLLITPPLGDGRGFFDRVEAALRGGVRAIQLRDKQSRSIDLLAAATELRAMTRSYAALLTLNDRADVAAAVGADGVHCGGSALPPAIVRRLLPTAWIGVSAHGQDGPDLVEGADYATYSPVFASPGKGHPTGLDALRHATERLGLPVLALGGIEAAYVPAIFTAGAVGVAVIRAIWDAPDVVAAAQKFIGAIEEAWNGSTIKN